MKLILFALIGSVAIQPATAQLQNRYQGNNPREIDARGNNYLLNTRNDGYRFAGDEANDRECLIERRTHKTVCRTRSQWEEAARRIEAGKSWR